MAGFTVIYDACVLYPAPLRDLLMRLAITRTFRARWTGQIHDEWINSLLRDREDLTEERLRRTAELMNAAVPDCLVTSYEPIIDQLTLPDPNDRHVLAAAIRADASAIVTMDLKHFPAQALESFQLEAIHPDAFIRDLADLQPQILERAAKQQRADLRNSQPSAEAFIENIRRQGLPGVASFLEDRMDLI